MARENLKKLIPSLGFEPLEDGYEYSNGNYTIFINGKNKISIISEMNDADEVDYLSIPSLEVISRDFLIKVFKALNVL